MAKTIIITGNPGVGKTTMVRDFVKGRKAVWVLGSEVDKGFHLDKISRDTEVIVYDEVLEKHVPIIREIISRDRIKLIRIWKPDIEINVPQIIVILGNHIQDSRQLFSDNCYHFCLERSNKSLNTQYSGLDTLDKKEVPNE